MLKEFLYNLSKYRKYFVGENLVPELLKLRDSSMSLVDFSKVKKYSVLGKVHEPNWNHSKNKNKKRLINFGKMA